MTGLREDVGIDRDASRRLLWLAAAAIVVAAIVVIAYRSRMVSPAPQRTVHLRLSGVEWAPYRTGKAPALASMTAQQRGVAEMLEDEPRRALTLLAKESESSSDPHVWNDLAVASYEAADHYAAPALLPDALAAADRALALSPGMPEALFNRAAILHRLGLRDDARAAWQRYLARDGESGWAVEARERLHTVQPEPAFLEALDRDPRRIDELVSRDPQGARLQGSIDLLARWASTRSPRDLDLARSLGARIAARNGDRLLEQTVHAIDVADAATRDVLAEGHRAYAEGIAAWNDDRPGDAEAAHTRAAKAFAAGNSALAFAARESAARMMYEQSRDADAIREEEAVLRDTPPSMPAVRASAEWLLGVLDTSAARWGQALDHLERAVAAFTTLGELDHASRVERIISFIYDRTGDPDKAWQHRLAALRGIGRTSTLALEKAISTMALAEMAARKWRVAESLLNLEVDVATRIHGDVQLTDTLLYRAAVRHQLGDDAGARRDVDDAERILARFKDDAYRALFQAYALRIRAELEPVPAKAVSILTSAIEVLHVRGDRMELPNLFLQRARVLRDSGDVRGAAADLERGMAELETSRESLPQGQSRWGVFYAHEELFEDAIDIAVDDRDAAAALRFAERARARALLDTYGRPAAFDPKRLPADTTLVEIVSLPKRLVLITPGRVTTVDVTREALRAEIDGFVAALRADDVTNARRIGASLYQRLVAPVATDAKTIVFVPDSTTSIVPFAALVDEQGEYLVERQAFAVAPSAAVYAAARRDPRPLHSVLVVSNEMLPNAAGEAKGVAAAYRTPREIHDAASLRSDAGADVIHFVGHAVGDESGLEPASIVLQNERMSVAEIASLRLRGTSVVVLAGCSTARGTRRGTEGAISVAYGFLTAGAPSVIATLWPIDDDIAAQFFPRLHRALASGLSPADALRAVQLDSIQRGDVPASLWASLQDIGS